MRPLYYVTGKIKSVRIKSYKAAVAASVILHAIFITALSFFGAGTSDTINVENSVYEEDITTKEYEVSYVNLESENTESSALSAAPAQPSVEIQGEEPSPMELITYRTETTVLTSATGKPRGYISGAVVENVEVTFAYLVVEAPPPPPAEEEKDLFYYLMGGSQSGAGSSRSGYGGGVGSIAIGDGMGGSCPSPNIININRRKPVRGKN